MKKRRRMFFDMDGTIVTWDPTASFEEVASPGYFANCGSMEKVVSALKQIAVNNHFELFILSSVFEDGHSIQDKNEWLDRYHIPIDEKHRIFVPYSKKKSDFVKETTGFLSNGDILIDDYTKNLKDWHGCAIKMLNGINATKGTWNGFTVSSNTQFEKLAASIEALAVVSEMI